MARIVVMLLVMACAACKSETSKKGSEQPAATVDTSSLPQLHVIKPHVFEVPYSCNGTQPSDLNKSALFLSEEARLAGRASVILNGVCDAAPYFSTPTEGADIGLMAVLGDVPLETVSASRAFRYKKGMTDDNVFKKIANFSPNQTFVAFLSRTTGRELIVFRVRSAEAAGPSFKNVRIEYIVRDYRVFNETGASVGFDWNKELY